MKMLSEHFTDLEFICRHCKKLPLSGIDMQLIYKLEVLRYKLGDKAIHIVSGYRCSIHNKSIHGAEHSQHMYGKAADITVDNIPVAKLLLVAEPIFYDGGIGKYTGFIHVDSRGVLVRWKELGK